MKTKTEYGVIKQINPPFQIRELLVVPHEEGDLTVSSPAFGPNIYSDNIIRMSESYSHPVTGETMTFTPATTSESISVAAYDFENMAKPNIFDPKWLQVGYIVRTQEGVFTNTNIADESKLKQLLNGIQKVNEIYLLNDRVAFAPYESFERGKQSCDTFAHGGLARALEHTPEKVAKNLREIASQKHYEKGVDVGGFNPVGKPNQEIAGLYSKGGMVGDRLRVFGDYRGGIDAGFAFGVLKNAEKFDLREYLV